MLCACRRQAGQRGQPELHAPAFQLLSDLQDRAQIRSVRCRPGAVLNDLRSATVRQGTDGVQLSGEQRADMLTLLQVYGSGTASRLAGCLLSVGTVMGPASKGVPCCEESAEAAGDACHDKAQPTFTSAEGGFQQQQRVPVLLSPCLSPLQQRRHISMARSSLSQPSRVRAVCVVVGPHGTC